MQTSRKQALKLPPAPLWHFTAHTPAMLAYSPLPAKHKVSPPTAGDHKFTKVIVFWDVLQLNDVSEKTVCLVFPRDRQTFSTWENLTCPRLAKAFRWEGTSLREEPGHMRCLTPPALTDTSPQESSPWWECPSLSQALGSAVRGAHLLRPARTLSTAFPTNLVQLNPTALQSRHRAVRIRTQVGPSYHLNSRGSPVLLWRQRTRGHKSACHPRRPFDTKGLFSHTVMHMKLLKEMQE